ncbi:MAG: hypothetical protein FJ026_13485 [Chloroflexi bacterium]|nr:hypothetical protein [Chloroflexota bacterium]
MAVAKNAAVALDPAQMTVAVAHPGGHSVQVAVQYSFEVITPLLRQLLGGGTLTLRSTATMYRGY